MALSVKSFSFASAAITFVLDVSGYVWHGLLQQPSMMNILYPGFWSNPALLALGLIGTVVGAYALGYLFAWTYNWHDKKS